jgi:hypothetical protein
MYLRRWLSFKLVEACQCVQLSPISNATDAWIDRMFSRIFAILMYVLRYLSAAKHSFLDRHRIALLVWVEFVKSWRHNTKRNNSNRLKISESFILFFCPSRFTWFKFFKYKIYFSRSLNKNKPSTVKQCVYGFWLKKKEKELAPFAKISIVRNVISNKISSKDLVLLSVRISRWALSMDM